MESILTTIKKMLGVDEADTNFDIDIIVHINTALMRLNQLGVGPVGGFSISDKTKTWTEYLGTRIDIEAVKSYIYIRVKLVFDPPTSSTLLEALDSTKKELEWCLGVQVEPVEEVV